MIPLRPVACTLEDDQARQRAEEWKVVAGSVLGIDRSAQRITVRLAGDDEVRHHLDRLVGAESECCGFVKWELRAQPDELHLTIMGDEWGVAAMGEAFSLWGLG